MWILIILMVSGGGAASFVPEFNSEAACITAKSQLIKAAEDKVISPIVLIQCVRKD